MTHKKSSDFHGGIRFQSSFTIRWELEDFFKIDIICLDDSLKYRIMAIKTNENFTPFSSSVTFRKPGGIACSRRSDSGERCEVKKAMKSRGGLGREVRVRSLSHLSSSLAFIFWRSFLLRTAPHYLNAWNRLHQK